LSNFIPKDEDEAKNFSSLPDIIYECATLVERTLNETGVDIAKLKFSELCEVRCIAHQ
jgi:hypothetical protein